MFVESWGVWALKNHSFTYMAHSLQNGMWNERSTYEFCLVCWETGILIIYFRTVYEKALWKKGGGLQIITVLWPKCVLFLQASLFETGSHIVQDGVKLTVYRDVLLTVPLPLRNVAVTGVNHYAVLYFIYFFGFVCIAEDPVNKMLFTWRCFH